MREKTGKQKKMRMANVYLNFVDHVTFIQEDNFAVARFFAFISTPAKAGSEHLDFLTLDTLMMYTEKGRERKRRGKSQDSSTLARDARPKASDASSGQDEGERGCREDGSLTSVKMGGSLPSRLLRPLAPGYSHSGNSKGNF